MSDFLEGKYWKDTDTSFFVDSDEDGQQVVSRHFQTQKGSAWGLASMKVLKAVISANSATDVSKDGGSSNTPAGGVPCPGNGSSMLLRRVAALALLSP